MENDEAVEVITKTLQSICFRDCEPEWDNCRHREATAWLTTLMAQIARKNDAI
jgi:hypothetical protein